jgi:hypothetical protein
MARVGAATSLAGSVLGAGFALPPDLTTKAGASSGWVTVTSDSSEELVLELVGVLDVGSDLVVGSGLDTTVAEGATVEDAGTVGSTALLSPAGVVET